MTNTFPQHTLWRNGLADRMHSLFGSPLPCLLLSLSFYTVFWRCPGCILMWGFFFSPSTWRRYNGQFKKLYLFVVYKVRFWYTCSEMISYMYWGYLKSGLGTFQGCDVYYEWQSAHCALRLCNFVMLRDCLWVLAPIPPTFLSSWSYMPGNHACHLCIYDFSFWDSICRWNNAIFVRSWLFLLSLKCSTFIHGVLMFLLLKVESYSNV